MDFNRLTLKSQEAVGAAQELARRAGNPEIYPEHLTLALLDQELPRTLVERSGHDPAELRAQAEAALSANLAPEAVKGMTPPADGMIGDLHGTPEYRAHLTGVLTARAVAAAG